MKQLIPGEKSIIAIKMFLFFTFFTIRLLGSSLPISSDAYAYHGSPFQNLTVIKPRVSTHGKSWVYAFYDPAYAAIFLYRLDDFHIFKGYDPISQVFYIVERYKGALDAYRGKQGSIYRISSDSFLSEQTSWSLEIVSSGKVPVDHEIKIHDAYDLLMELEAEGRISIYFYPDRPSEVPEHDSDLINKAVFFIRKGYNVKEKFLKLYPQYQERLELAI